MSELVTTSVAGAVAVVEMHRPPSNFFDRELLSSLADAIIALDAGGHTAPVRAMAFRSDGRELVTVSTDKTLRVWNVPSGQTSRTLRTPICTAI